jgi:hypothetical protein
MDIGDKFDLPWMPFDRLPTSCHADSNNEMELASSYIGDLFGRWSITILPSSTDKLLLLFTFDESDSIYLVATPSEESLYLSTPVSIPFTNLNQYKFWFC